MILKNSKFKKHSKIVCDPVDLQEGHEIASKLFIWLSRESSGVGLAAPQIGVHKRVCVVHVDKPLIFINPKIEEADGKFVYAEGCLSYPNQLVKTNRFREISVSAENLDQLMTFQVGPNPRLTLECVAIQHEIDHLDGITIFDREFKAQPVKASTKIGRNEMIDITNGEELRTLKYKKAKPLLDIGEWEIYVGGPIT
tara:strand:- start:1530 stop:2120 length:591 start_codon:yes stop_codon:yes gene_type:complete